MDLGTMYKLIQEDEQSRVHLPEGEGRGLGVEADEGGARRVALQEAGAEPLRVALGDESALVGRDGQDLSRLEGLQLGRRAGGTVDLQLVAALVDGVQRH